MDIAAPSRLNLMSTAEFEPEATDLSRLRRF